MQKQKEKKAAMVCVRDRSEKECAIYAYEANCHRYGHTYAHNHIFFGKSLRAKIFRHQF